MQIHSNEEPRRDADQALDLKLESAAQQQIRGMVHGLSDESPSMAWRSTLNERVLAEASKRKTRRRFWWIVSPSFGLAGAFGLAFLMLVHPAKMPHTTPNLANAATAVPAQPSLEDSLLSSHNESTVAQDVTGDGLSAQEVKDSTTDDNGEDNSDL